MLPTYYPVVYQPQTPVLPRALVEGPTKAVEGLVALGRFLGLVWSAMPLLTAVASKMALLVEGNDVALVHRSTGSGVRFRGDGNVDWVTKRNWNVKTGKWHLVNCDIADGYLTYEELMALHSRAGVEAKVTTSPVHGHEGVPCRG